MPAKKAAAAPSFAYTEELGAAVCERMLQPSGDNVVTSLRKVCEAGDMPHIAMVMRWIAKGRRGEAPYDEFVVLYDATKQLQADFGADEIVEISDEVKETTEAVQKAKLRVSSRQWRAEKLLPKKYGNKTELSGSLTISHEQALDRLR